MKRLLHIFNIIVKSTSSLINHDHMHIYPHHLPIKRRPEKPEKPTTSTLNKWSAIRERRTCRTSVLLSPPSNYDSPDRVRKMRENLRGATSRWEMPSMYNFALGAQSDRFLAPADRWEERRRSHTQSLGEHGRLLHSRLRVICLLFPRGAEKFRRTKGGKRESIDESWL